MEKQTVNRVEIFSATKAREREFLGERITDWLRLNPTLEVVDKIVTQSSDHEFHCLALTFFCYLPPKTVYKAPPVREVSNSYNGARQ